LRRDAPGIRLTVRRLARPRVSEELASGRIDLAVGWVDRPSDVHRDDLFMEDFVCIVRPRHPRITKRLTLAQFSSEWHLVVGRPDAGPDVFLRATNAAMEKVFSKAVRERRVALLVPHFLAVPNIICNTDLLCVVPRQLGQVYEAYGQVRIVALPVACGSFAVSQFWHKRFDSDQGNVWLRAQIGDLFRRRTKT
jgi:DNA-binding transcriptional LysR family regulator